MTDHPVPKRAPVRAITRRRALAGGVAGVAGLTFAGFELVSHGVLPGRDVLDRLDGACSVPAPQLVTTPPGPSRSATFFSRARRRTVGYTIAYPPGHQVGDRLALALSLHGFGGNHASRLGGMSLAGALAAHPPHVGRAPMALAAADGGGGYWNPHPGDDPMAMLIEELIPICRRLGLGTGTHRIGAIGFSMGGYGALLLAERHPHLVGAVAAISPAVWTSFAQAQAANAGAYASAQDFARDDVVTHATRLGTIPTRIASGDADPFHPGVEALAGRLPASATVIFTGGCHDGAFAASQAPASLDFLAAHLESG